LASSSLARDCATGSDAADQLARLETLDLSAMRQEWRRLYRAEPPRLSRDLMGPYAARLIRLNYLAPDIVAAILGGKQPADLTANKLMADTRFPVDWRAQRAALGFV
jgi:hypothetical protein